MKKHTEDALQAEIVRWFNNEYCLKSHSPRFIIFSVANELLTKLQGALEYKFKNQPTILKIVKQVASIVYRTVVAMGLLSGVSDLIVVLQGKVLFVELKLPTGRQSKAQIDFQDRVNDLDHPYFIIRSLEEFKILIKSQL